MEWLVDSRAKVSQYDLIEPTVFTLWATEIAIGRRRSRSHGPECQGDESTDHTFWLCRRAPGTVASLCSWTPTATVASSQIVAGQADRAAYPGLIRSLMSARRSSNGRNALFMALMVSH